MKKLISLFLSATMMTGLVFNNILNISANEEPDAATGEVFFADVMNDKVVIGDEAENELGSEFFEQLKNDLESKDDFLIPQEIYNGQQITTALDMKAYDVNKFADKYTTLAAKASGTGLDSIYEASAFVLAGIMTGNSWKQTHTSGQNTLNAAYVSEFTFNAQIPTTRASEILMAICYNVYAYFPHYFNLGGNYTVGTDPDTGAVYINKFTMYLYHSSGNNFTDNGVSKFWKEEYDEVTRLLATDEFKNLTSTADKLKKAHDYIADAVTYTYNEKHNGQQAYCALIEKKPVCNGYALAYSMLCLRMGLDVAYMRGDAGGPHAWNIDMTDYGTNKTKLLTDVTWDDQPSLAGGIYYEHYRQNLDDYRVARTWLQGEESFLEYANGANTSDLYQGYIFSEMASSTSAIVQSVTTDNSTIDLMNETITLDGISSVGAYSLDGGKKWKKTALPTDDKFPKLFNKEMTLVIASEYDAANKTGGGTIVKFPTIAKRPKKNEEKLAPYYTNSTSWYLAKKNSDVAVYSGYQYALSSNGKTPDDDWLDVPASGFTIKESTDDKDTYLFRTPPASGATPIPASQPFKIKAQNFGKAPKLKIDYKKEILKIKKAHSYSINGSAFTEVTESKGVTLDVADYITAGANFRIKKDATGKKPATDIQSIDTVARAEFKTMALTCAKGKITTKFKEYEVYDSNKNKWGNLPKVNTEGVHVFDIRLKSTAKLSKNVWGGNAASPTGKISVTYGTYDDNGKEKTGITAAEITLTVTTPTALLLEDPVINNSAAIQEATDNNDNAAALPAA